jgi:outer membrane lipoprotein carrier protein
MPTDRSIAHSRRLRAGTLLLGVFVLSLPGFATAAELEPQAVHEIVADYLDATENYTAQFSQRVFDERGELVEEGSGQLWLQRPGTLRWHYELPWEREIIATQERILMYDAELEQVTIRSAEGALTATPAALLVGDIGALDRYELSGQEDADDIVAVRLRPLDNAGDFTEIGLGFVGRKLAQLLLFDRFGQKTVIDFSNIDVNAMLDPAVFDFEIPATADVIDESAG